MSFADEKFILKLTIEECDLLISILSSSISETRNELNQTDKYELSQELNSVLISMRKILSTIIKTTMIGNRTPATIH